MRVDILEKQELYASAFFRLEAVRLRYELFSGAMGPEITRINLERGDSAAAVVHDAAAGTVILSEQFRYGAYAKGPGWLLEIPAGIVQPSLDASPEDTIRRELKVEIGYEIATLESISTFYPSPGGSSERIFLYYACVTHRDRTGEGGGALDEGENIRRVVLPVGEVFAKLDQGEIQDAKTLIGLQWLRARLGA